MCNMVLEENRKTTGLISNHDKNLANEIVEKSKEITIIAYNLERECIRFLAMEQPFAGDLMYIESTIRVLSHIKRISSLSSNIAESSEYIQNIDIPDRLLEDLQYMADYVQIMLSKGFNGFLNQDLNASKELSEDDNKVDDLFDSILKQTADLIAKKTNQPFGLISLIFISRYLERMADRVVSIGTRVIFIKTHERPDIEHLKEEN